MFTYEPAWPLVGAKIHFIIQCIPSPCLVLKVFTRILKITHLPALLQLEFAVAVPASQYNSQGGEPKSQQTALAVALF